MVSLVGLLPAEEQPLVRAHAHRLQRVAARVPGISERVRRRTCVQVASIAPQLDIDRLSLLLRHALWLYWLDNRLDSPGLDPAAAAGLRDGVTAVTLGDEPSPADPLLAELASIVRGLSRYDQTGDVVKWYGGALRDALVAEIARLVARYVETEARRPRTAEQYLAVAGETVNYRSFAYALLAAGNDPLTGRQLQLIDPALRRASYAVRLGNDLRSLARDNRAGTGNILRLRAATGQVVTTGYVWDEVGRHAREHDAALRTLAERGVVPQAATEALIRCLAQAIRLYSSTDLR